MTEQNLPPEIQKSKHQYSNSENWREEGTLPKWLGAGFSALMGLGLLFGLAGTIAISRPTIPVNRTSYQPVKAIVNVKKKSETQNPYPVTLYQAKANILESELNKTLSKLEKSECANFDLELRLDLSEEETKRLEQTLKDSYRTNSELSDKALLTEMKLNKRHEEFLILEERLNKSREDLEKTRKYYETAVRESEKNRGENTTLKERIRKAGINYQNEHKKALALEAQLNSARSSYTNETKRTAQLTEEIGILGIYSTKLSDKSRQLDEQLKKTRDTLNLEIKKAEDYSAKISQLEELSCRESLASGELKEELNKARKELMIEIVNADNYSANATLLEKGNKHLRELLKQQKTRVENELERSNKLTSQTRVLDAELEKVRNTLRDETTKARDYETKLSQSQGDNKNKEESLKRLRTELARSNEEISKYIKIEVELEKTKQKELAEGKIINSLLTAFPNMPEFPLVSGIIDLEKRNAVLDEVYYLQTRAVTNRTQFDSIVDIISMVYTPDNIQTNAFELWIKKAGLNPETAREFESGLAQPTKYDSIAQFLFANNQNPQGVIFKEIDGNVRIIAGREQASKLLHDKQRKRGRN